MANYSMAPYAFWGMPRYARGGERRPIEDYDGNGLKLRSIFERAIAEIEGDQLVADPIDDSRHIRATRVVPYSDFIFVEFGVGRSGYVGALHQRSGDRVHFQADEANETLVRAIFAFPTGGHEVYWLSEKAGNTSGFSSMQRRILNLMREACPDMTAKVAPVAEWAAIQQWANQVSVQEMRFDAPRPHGSTQAIDVNGIRADVRITIKPRGGLTLNRLVTADGPDRNAIFGFLSGSPLITDSGANPESVLEAGWRAQVAFKTRSGRQRSFGLSIEDTAPTLIYPVGALGEGRSRSYRPTDVDFAGACGEFLSDVEGRLPGLVSVHAAILANVT